MKLPVHVTSATESTARDRATINAGVPSRALMQRAGAMAAAEIAHRYSDRLERGVLVVAGPGNNGGDGWVVGRALAASGVVIHVDAVGDANTEDSRMERALARPLVRPTESVRKRKKKTEAVPAYCGVGLIVDALLGTGARGPARDAVAEAIQRINLARANGAIVVALDVPSGMDATSGEASLAVGADLTLSFGDVKRGLLVARGIAGRIVVLDVGLLPREDDSSPVLADAAWVTERLPTIPANAHKGSRGRLAIIGGARGMAGAPMLAARAAMRSGIGIVRILVAPENVNTVQGALPYALANEWPRGERAERDCGEMIGQWADGVLIGPGLGNTPESRELVERVLRCGRGPVVLDADAINVFANDAPTLGRLLGGRPALLTPHVLEFSRLSGTEPAAVLDGRFDIGAELARILGAAVLLKGVPTVVSDANGERVVSATGTPALAAAGSGDLLAGIAATLLTQTRQPLVAGACAAWVHGRAAELAGREDSIRGVTVADIEDALASAWEPEERCQYPVLVELPPIGREPR